METFGKELGGSAPPKCWAQCLASIFWPRMILPSHLLQKSETWPQALLKHMWLTALATSRPLQLLLSFHLVVAGGFNQLLEEISYVRSIIREKARVTSPAKLEVGKTISYRNRLVSGAVLPQLSNTLPEPGLAESSCAPFSASVTCCKPVRSPLPPRCSSPGLAPMPTSQCSVNSLAWGWVACGNLGIT